MIGELQAQAPTSPPPVGGGTPLEAPTEAKIMGNFRLVSRYNIPLKRTTTDGGVTYFTDVGMCGHIENLDRDLFGC